MIWSFACLSLDAEGRVSKTSSPGRGEILLTPHVYRQHPDQPARSALDLRGAPRKTSLILPLDSPEEEDSSSDKEDSSHRLVLEFLGGHLLMRMVPFICPPPPTLLRRWNWMASPRNHRLLSTLTDSKHSDWKHQRWCGMCSARLCSR